MHGVGCRNGIEDKTSVRVDVDVAQWVGFVPVLE